MIETISDKKAKILKTTLKIIATRGIHDTPISLVAKEAGVSVGIIYHYFANKDELVYQLYRQTKLEIAQAMLPDLPPDAPVKKYLKLSFEKTIDFFRTYPDKLIFLELYSHSPLSKHGINDEVDCILAPTTLVLEKAIEQNMLTNLPVEIFEVLCYDVAISLVKKHQQGRITLSSELIDIVFAHIWKTVKGSHDTSVSEHASTH